MTESRTEPKAVVILGAGWSFAAGLPLAKDLISPPLYVSSKKAMYRSEQVLAAFARWSTENPDSHTELFLRECYRGAVSVPWLWVAEFIQAKLGNSHPADRRGQVDLRYGQRITTRTYCAEHIQFWLDLLTNFHLHAAITTNYDVLVERSLRTRAMKRPPLPGFHYAGLGRVVAKGQAQPWRIQEPEREITPSGRVPLIKLHGSLNWSLARQLDPQRPPLPFDDQHNNDQLEIFQDLRAAFRHGGTAAIVPPLPEKEAPRWAQKLWETAAHRLAEAPIWIVVGYSLPAYDIALRQLFSLAATTGRLRDIRLHDPYSAAISNEWASVTKVGSIVELPGLERCVYRASR
jgi:hypothetical protein